MAHVKPGPNKPRQTIRYLGDEEIRDYGDRVELVSNKNGNTEIYQVLGSEEGEH